MTATDAHAHTVQVHYCSAPCAGVRWLETTSRLITDTLYLYTQSTGHRRKVLNTPFHVLTIASIRLLLPLWPGRRCVCVFNFIVRYVHTDYKYATWPISQKDSRRFVLCRAAAAAAVVVDSKENVFLSFLSAGRRCGKRCFHASLDRFERARARCVSHMRTLCPNPCSRAHLPSHSTQTSCIPF